MPVSRRHRVPGTSPPAVMCLLADWSRESASLPSASQSLLEARFFERPDLSRNEITLSLLPSQAPSREMPE